MIRLTEAGELLAEFSFNQGRDQRQRPQTENKLELQRGVVFFTVWASQRISSALTFGGRPGIGLDRRAF